jgi:hypothetical protein
MTIESDDCVVVTPISVEIEKGKQNIVFEVQTENKETADKAAKAYGDSIGATSVEFVGKSSSSFGFDSRRWGGSNWEPKGSQKNPDLN